MTRNNNTGHPLLHNGLEIDESSLSDCGCVLFACNEYICVRFHSLVFALFGQRRFKNPVNKVVQSLFVCLECFEHALAVNQLAYFVGVQSRLTTCAVTSRDAEQQRRQLRECQAAAVAAVSLPWPRVRKRAAGHPGRRDHWHALLYGIIGRREMLPAYVTNEPPPWWRLGMPVARTAADVAAELAEISTGRRTSWRGGVAQQEVPQGRCRGQTLVPRVRVIKEKMYGWDMVHDDGAFELRHPRKAHLRRQDSQGATDGSDAC